MKEYTIVMEVGAKDLEGRVNSLIAEGWQPLGGVAVITSTEIIKGAIVVTFYQAMGR